MLSNLIVAKQKFVLVKDELGHERISQKFITQLLKEQGEDKHIKILARNEDLSDSNTINKFLSECEVKPPEEGKLWNIILPNLSDFLSYQKVSVIFQLLSKLKKCDYVKRTFLWISLHHLQHEHAQFVVAAFEYMADMVLHFLTTNDISLLICKPGGGISFKYYIYTRTKSGINAELRPNIPNSNAANANCIDDQKAEQLGTFKIELDEEEIVARNAMKLPYEKAVEATESNIIYTPDAADDFDEEDPDEDLNI